MPKSASKEDRMARIRALMERRGMTQAELSRYLGVPHGTIGNWLQGTRHPTAVVDRLLDVLGLVEALAPALHDSMVAKK